MAASVPHMVKVYYGRPMLPDVSRVLACLYEKEIDFKLVDMYDGQYMPSGILRLQATMRAPVPAFEDGSTVLLDSRAICRYASEKYADHGNRYLLGRDLLERGSIEQWLKTEEQSYNPPTWALVFHLAFAPRLTNAAEPDRSLLAQSEQTLAKVLDVYEHRLRESKYLAGDEFTLADLSHLPNTHYIANSKEWGYLFDSRKNVQRWREKISNRPSWAKVVEIMNEVGVLKGASVADQDAATAQDTSLQQLPSVSTDSLSVKFGPLTQTSSTRASHVPPSAFSVKTSPETAPIEPTGPPPASKISVGTSAEPTAPAIAEIEPPSVPQTTETTKLAQSTSTAASTTQPASTHQPPISQATEQGAETDTITKSSPLSANPTTSSSLQSSQTASSNAEPATSAEFSPETGPKPQQDDKTTTTAKSSRQAPSPATNSRPRPDSIAEKGYQPDQTASPNAPIAKPDKLSANKAESRNGGPYTRPDAPPDPSSRPTPELKSSNSSTREPDSAIAQKNTPTAPISKPNSRPEQTMKPTPPGKQGASSAGPSTSVTNQSNPPDSADSSAASDRPNSQPSSDT